MSQATWYTGDAMEVLRTLPDASVDLVMTSPPFLALRSYLPADHEHKALEIGSEATPGAFLDVLLDVTEELARVLAPHGSLVVELGDTYSGSGGAGGDYLPGGLRDGQPGFAGSSSRSRHHEECDLDGDCSCDYLRQRDGNAAHWRAKNAQRDAWPLPKSLCMIPSSYAWALAYGRNPWTGRTTPAWRVRNLVAWCRPNPPVGALGDKFRPGTSYLTVACKSANRYFDLDAVREPHQHGVDPATMGGNGYGYRQPAEKGNGTVSMPGNPAGAPPLDWWEIPTHPYPGSHYATFPPQLCVRPIKAMCPAKVCRVCGKPSERITEDTPELAAAKERFKWESGGLERGLKKDAATRVDVSGARLTVGWSDCGHDDWRNGIVLDPFAGSGTTAAVATGHGRDAVGIDLDPRNLELARERIGMFLQEAEVA